MVEIEANQSESESRGSFDAERDLDLDLGAPNPSLEGVLLVLSECVKERRTEDGDGDEHEV